MKIEDQFEYMTEWCKKNPGKKTFVCQFCGVYEASKPRCSDCEETE
jgi:hypothetical protein